MTELPVLTNSLAEVGVVLTILSVVLLLLFLYFKNLINQKSILERQLDTNKGLISNIIRDLQKLKEDIIEVKLMLRGGFRTRGRDDE